MSKIELSPSQLKNQLTQSAINSNKSKHNMKKFQFYNSFVTRQDIISLSELGNDVNRFNEFVISKIIRRFEDNLKNHSFQHEKSSSVFSLITFEYTVNTQVSQATQEAQIQCRNSIFCEYLRNLYVYCEKNNYNFEQKSTLLSIAFFIYAESLERKMTLIDSYELFKKIVKTQILLTNAMNLPLFTQKQIIDFNDFMTNTFYKYYSLYELRMIIYQEVNIFTKQKGELESQKVANDMEEQDTDQENQKEEDDQGENDEYQDEQDQGEVSPVIHQKTAAEEQAEKIIDKEIQNFSLLMENKLTSQEEKLLKEAQDLLTKKK